MKIRNNTLPQMKISKRFSFSLLILFFQIGYAQVKSLEISPETVPEKYTFQWNKANGDMYNILVENHLQAPIKPKILARTFMQILLKATLKSKAFETFTPQRFSLYNDGNVLIASLRFSFLDQNDKDQEELLYYRFDVYGNVFNVLE